MLNPRDILYVTAIAEEKSFSKAARRLYISQPALSQSILKLEKRLGMPVLRRLDSGLELTPAGRLLVEEGRQVLSSLQGLEQKMSLIVNMQEAKLRIGISQFYSEYHLSRFLPHFQKQFPGVMIELFEEKSLHLEELTLDGTVDFAMVPLPLAYKKLEYQILHQEQILFATPPDHPLKVYATPSLSSNLPFMDISRARTEPFIFLKKQRFTEMGLRICRDAGFEPTILYESKNWDTVSAFISSGLGVGFLPEVLASPSEAKRAPDCYRIDGENTTRPYAVIYQSRAHLSVAALNFIRVAQEVFSGTKG